MNDKRVTLVNPGKGIGDRIFPPDMVEYLNLYYRDKGVKVRTGDHATGLDKDSGSDALNLSTQSGAAISVDGLVAGIGIEPNTELARDAGLEVKDGIVVDELLRTSHPDIYAAGDVATFFD